MPPTRTASMHTPLRRQTTPLGVGHIRPRDLAAAPSPPRVHTTPAERFVGALLEGDRLGLGFLKGTEHLSNVKIEVSVEELPGKIEGIYQDSSTWKLVLYLKPDMFMTPLRVQLAEFLGGSYAADAPTWLARLGDLRGEPTARVRSYKWIEKFVVHLLTTPHTRVPRAPVWREMLTYVWRIKEVCDMAHRTPRDPSTPRPKPRPRRSGNMLAGAMAALTLEGGVASAMAALSLEGSVAAEPSAVDTSIEAGGYATA